MHNLKQNFDRFLPIVKESLKTILDSNGNIPKTGRTPKFSDSEIIAMSLVSESLSIDSENLLFKKLICEYQKEIPNLIDRSQYNRRRRFLFPYIEYVRRSLVKQLVTDNTFVLDSMPIEICRFPRAKRIKICKEKEDTSPEFGYCASQKMHYYGYKLHGVCSFTGVITHFDLSKANVADIHYLRDIEDNYPNCLILGDKAYIGSEYQIELFSKKHLQLETPKRMNQLDYKRQPWFLRKVRKRIETIFSQLVDQFLVRKNYAKTFAGLATRIVSKITAFTILQLINKMNNKPLNHVKHALA